MAGTASSGGRNKKSLAEHALDGTGRKDRGTSSTTSGGGELPPEPPKGRPPVPAGLSGHALDEWDRMVTRLEAAQTLSIVDDAALYQYCSLFGETEATQDARRNVAALLEELQATASVTKEPVDVATIVKLQQLEMKYTTQLRQGRMALRAYLVEFGMTPSARTRVKLPPAPKAEDPMAEFDEAPKA